jgi:hypothetical protein
LSVFQSAALAPIEESTTAARAARGAKSIASGRLRVGGTARGREGGDATRGVAGFAVEALEGKGEWVPKGASGRAGVPGERARERERVLEVGPRKREEQRSMTKGQQKAAGGPRATAGGAKGGRLLEAGLKTRGRQRQVAAPDQEVVRELGQRLDLLVCASLCSLACVDMVEVEGDGCS